MTRFLGFAIFFSIACVILAGVHYYFWLRLVRDTHLTGPARHLATTLVASLAALIVATALSGRLAPRLGHVLAWPGFVWMGAMFVLLVILLGTDVLRLLAVVATRLARLGVEHDPSRRVFGARLLAGAVLTGTAAVTAAAVRATQSDIAVKRLDITLDRLPPALDGTKIVQICDMHVGGLLGRRFVEHVVATSNRLEADLIAVVGDLVDGSIEQLRPVLAPMTELRARHGVFFVLGNHEYYSRSSPRAWIAEFERMGFRVLGNEHVRIGGEREGFDLAGVYDHGASRFPAEGPPENVAQALHGRDASRAVVLLAHQPKTIFEAARLGVDLQLSGHTHGGQIQPWGALVRLQQPFVRGLHRVGNTQIYVSSGTGFWGPPMRLGAPAEITEIILRAKTKSV
ncbi:MAG: metallophosphoesterase [Deltaproteobacteria bacterium]|nr:metallophosphoesterase [Deltaproteobacteria bacterium]